MKNSPNNTNQFIEIQSLSKLDKAKIKLTVNTGLIELYWQIGAYFNKKLNTSEWGKSVVQDLSDFINKNKPDIKGFSTQNIWIMRQFYEVYSNNEKLSAVLRENSYVKLYNNLHITFCCVIFAWNIN
jgi:hypothetical protein